MNLLDRLLTQKHGRPHDGSYPRQKRNVGPRHSCPRRTSPVAPLPSRKGQPNQWPVITPPRSGASAAAPLADFLTAAYTSGRLTPSAVQHRVSKHLRQGIESDHFHVKKNMPKIGGFRSFATAKRTIAGFEAMLWLKKGFGFAGEWTVRRQNELLALCFGLEMVNNP